MIARGSAVAYGTLGTLFHDADTPGASEIEVAWYASRLPRDAGLVLEAMAGSGRLLAPLLEAGFQMHIVKPVDPDELMVVIRSLVNRVGSQAQRGAP